MARGVNKVILIGNLGNDPEVRYLPTGGAVANFTIATSESWTDKATNEKKEQTEWHRIVIYQRLAEIAVEYLRKGSKVYLEGKLKTRKWQDQQGVERYTTEIVCNELQMLDGKQDGAAPAQARQAQQPVAQRTVPQAAPQPQQGYQQMIGKPPVQQSPQQGGFGSQDFDDDIPFAPIGLSCRRSLHCM